MTTQQTMQPSSGRWALDKKGIVWNVAQDDRLPHADHIEMSGRKVSLIVHYHVDKQGCLSLEREVIWPMLRHRKDDVRGYLRRTYGDEVLPRFLVNDEPLELGPLACINFDGVLTFEYRPVRALTIHRTLFPSPVASLVIEHWEVRYRGRQPIRLALQTYYRGELDNGVYGRYALSVHTNRSSETVLSVNDYAHFDTTFKARIENTESGFTRWGDDI